MPLVIAAMSVVSMFTVLFAAWFLAAKGREDICNEVNQTRQALTAVLVLSRNRIPAEERSDEYRQFYADALRLIAPEDC